MYQEPRFQLPNGEVLQKCETNRHHVIYPEYKYKGRLQRYEYRSMSGLVIRMSLLSHKELHENVPPPIKPSNNLIRAVVEHSKLLDIDSDAFDKFKDINSYLGYLASYANSDKINEEAGKLHDNFNQQEYFIKTGRVVDYDGE